MVHEVTSIQILHHKEQVTLERQKISIPVVCVCVCVCVAEGSVPSDGRHVKIEAQ